MGGRQRPLRLKCDPNRELSFHEVHERIAAIRKMDLRKADIDTLHWRLFPLLEGAKGFAKTYGPADAIYRAVLWRERPTHQSQLSYPPAERVTGIQRASRPGQSRFYGSSAREAPLFELGVQPGDRIALSRWLLTDQVRLMAIGFHPAVYAERQSSFSVDLPWRASEKVHFKPAHRLTYEFVSRTFAAPVERGSEYRYKLSVALAELLQGVVPRETDPALKFSWVEQGKLVAGLVYPPLAMRGNGENFCFPPAIADRALAFDCVEYMEVLEAHDMMYRVLIKDIAVGASPDGELQWGALKQRSWDTLEIFVDGMSGHLSIPSDESVIEVLTSEPSPSILRYFGYND